MKVISSKRTLYFCGFFFCFLTGLSGNIQAEVDLDEAGTQPSTITVDISADKADGRGMFVNADVAVWAGLRASVGGGDNFSANNRTETKTSTFHAGLSTNPIDVLVFGLDVERWGKSGVLTTRTSRADFSLSFSDWSIRFSPARLEIDVYSEEPRVYQLRADVYSVNIGYYSMDGWFIDAGYIDYVYYKDFRLAAYRALLRNIFDPDTGLSPETFELLTVLDEDQSTLRIGMDVGNGLLGVDWSRSHAVYKTTSHKTLSAYYEKNISDQWSVAIQVGQQSSDLPDSDPVLFLSINQNYFW